MAESAGACFIQALIGIVSGFVLFSTPYPTLKALQRHQQQCSQLAHSMLSKCLRAQHFMRGIVCRIKHARVFSGKHYLALCHCY